MFPVEDTTPVREISDKKLWSEDILRHNAQKPYQERIKKKPRHEPRLLLRPEN